jgi:hypothetical protein
LGKCRFFLKKPLDFGLLNSHSDAFGHCTCRRQAFRLSGQAPFPHEFVSAQDCDHGFLALPGYDGDFDFSFLDIENRVRVIALRKDDFFLAMLRNDSAIGCGFKECYRVKLPLAPPRVFVFMLRSLIFTLPPQFAATISIS